MILIVTEIKTLAVGEQSAMSCEVHVVKQKGYSDLENDMSKMILSKIQEGQDLLSKCAEESVTLEGADVIEEFGPATTERFKKNVK